MFRNTAVGMESHSWLMATYRWKFNTFYHNWRAFDFTLKFHSMSCRPACSYCHSFQNIPKNSSFVGPECVQKIQSLPFSVLNSKDLPLHSSPYIKHTSQEVKYTIWMNEWNILSFTVHLLSGETSTLRNWNALMLVAEIDVVTLVF